MSDTLQVSASDFQRRFGQFREVATAGSIVEVTAHNRVVGAYIAGAELQSYLRFRELRRQAGFTRDAGDDLIALVEAAEYGTVAQGPAPFPAPSAEATTIKPR